MLDRNIYLNGMEFDILLPDKIILEYNGLTHYRINSSAKKPTMIRHDKWKRAVLNSLGYLVIDIPFYEWEKFPNEK